MWPWVEHGSCSAWGLFLFYFSFVDDQTQTSTWPNHDQDFESHNLKCSFAKSFKLKYTENVADTLFSLLCENIFSFGFIEALDLKEILIKLKKVLHQPWNALIR